MEVRGERAGGPDDGPDVEVRGERVGGPGDRSAGLNEPKPSPGFGVPGADDGEKGDGTLNEAVTGEPNVPVLE